MKILSFTIIVISFIYLVAGITGYIISPEFETEQEVLLDYSEQSVWNVLNDIQGIPEGKRGTDSVDILGKYLNLYAWIENHTSGNFSRYRQVLKEDKERLIIEMTDSSYGLTGTWEFNISTLDGKTLIKVKQNSTNTSIIGRGFRFYFGRDKETKEWIKFLRVRLFNRLLTTP